MNNYIPNNLPDSICMLPWISMETSPIGSARPCCLAEEEITDSNGEKFELTTHSLEQVYKSVYMQDLRRQFRQGQKPSTCNKCWTEESSGKKSKRLYTFDRLKEWVDQVDWNNDVPDQLWFLDLKLGNICNLKCRICGSWSSSKWAEEEMKYTQSTTKKKDHLAYTFLQKGRWPRQSEEFWKNLNQLLPQVRYFEFTGGEPWMIKEHFEILQQAVDRGLAKDIEIHYNTNATQQPEEHFDLWSHFKRVDIAFSVDNIESRFEYERYGAKWHTANSIIDSVHDFRSRAKNITTQLCFTINIQNVYYLDQLLTWALTKNFDSVHFNMLHGPDCMSVKKLTPAAKDLVLEKLKTTQPDIKFQSDWNALISYIEDSECSDGSEFLYKMKQTDQYRNQCFLDTHEEIARAMGYEK